MNAKAREGLIMAALSALRYLTVVVQHVVLNERQLALYHLVNVEAQIEKIRVMLMEAKGK